MVDRVEISAEETGATAPEPVKEANPNRPEWLDEKFESPEDMQKAYHELQSKFSQTPAETSKTEPTAETNSETNNENTFDINNYYNEYADKGELSEKSYEALAAQGLDKELINSYIQGQEALAEKFTAEMHDIAGGKQQYTDMMAWAEKSMSPEYIETFNKAVSSPDKNAATMAIQALNSQYKEAVGSSPSLLKGSSSSSNTGQGFESWAQLTTAINDPRYSQDPAFRKSVMDRLNVSKF